MDALCIFRTHLMLNKQEFWALNWLRFFLSLYIVTFHTLNEPYGLVTTHPFVSSLLDLGNFATSIFFVLSGFLLTYVYVSLRGDRKIDKSSFLVARLSALYPIHLFTIILALPFFLAVIYRDGGIAVPLDVFWKHTRLLGNGETMLAVLMNLTLTHAWNPLYLLLNPPSWSLSALLFFYLLFPYLAPWLNKMRRPMVGLIVLGVLFFLPGAIAQLAGWTDIVTDGVLHRNPVVRLPLFLGGVLLCVMYARRAPVTNDKPGFISTAILISIVMITIAIAAYWQIINPEHRMHVIRNGLYYPAALAIVWIFANAGPSVSKWNLRWSARLGKASLSIFALHYPMFDIMRRGEKFLRAYIITRDEDKPLSLLLQVAKKLDENIIAYPIYFILVILAALALQENIVNPVQAFIKKRFALWKSERRQSQIMANTGDSVGSVDEQTKKM
jgi:peptidoglycan/LPS O-acetylase OafA/YrhL